MSADGDMPAPHEVVIVRRRGGDGDDGHHGGAWKIAFADLMTAMMAFFLVMWLLNVSDKEKIQQIATYFNPLKLNAQQPTVKGVGDDVPTAAPASVGPSERGADKSTVDDEHKRQKASKRGGDGELQVGAERQAEEELFNDPYGVLARLANEAESQIEQTNVVKNDSTMQSGESYNNPFESFASRSNSQPESVQSEHKQITLGEPGTHPLPPGLEKPLEIKPDVAQDGPPDATAPKQPSPAAAGHAQSGPADEKLEALQGELSKALADVAPDHKPNIEVRRVDEGVLISLTDDFRFGMFGSASAEPRPELVLVMEKIAKVLASHEGSIIVRGHTDARPFRTERNNNWRLSMDRAQVAYYMLARGGVDERRFESIEGRADRSLKIPDDPNAAENRRIEIMLRPKS